MGISTQITVDFKSSQNDKDLIETPKVQDFNSIKKHSKIPDYAKDYKNEYLFIIGIDGCFEYYARSIYNQRYYILDSRVPRINKYLDAYDRTINGKIEIEASDVKNTILLIRLLNLIKENFDRFVEDTEPDVNDTNFYYPDFMNLLRCVLRLK